MTVLSGMDEICKYCKRSEKVVASWIKNKGFPASKLNGGKWVSGSELVDAWIKKKVMEDVCQK